MPAAPAIAAARSQPVTPPMRMKSGITKSQALRPQRRVQVARAVEVLADLDRRLQVGGEPRIAVEIVVDHRLLDPGQAGASSAWQRSSASARSRPWLKSTIRAMSSPTAPRTASKAAMSSRDPLASEPQLEPGEAALVAQLQRLRRHRLRLLQPQPVAVVGPHRADRAAEQHAERHARRPGQRVPRRHVEAGDGDHRHAPVADEVQRPARQAVQLDGRHRLALEHLAEIVQRRDQIVHRLGGVGLEIAPPDHALLGVQVDQDQRPLGDGGDARDHRPLQLEHDRPRGDGPQGERCGLHGVFLPRALWSAGRPDDAGDAPSGRRGTRDRTRGHRARVHGDLPACSCIRRPGAGRGGGSGRTRPPPRRGRRCGGRAPARAWPILQAMATPSRSSTRPTAGRASMRSLWAVRFRSSRIGRPARTPQPQNTKP